MKFEDYFSFEAILGDLVKWRLAGKDVGGTLPPRAEWKRGGFRERRGRSLRPPPTNPSYAGIWYNTRRLGRWGRNRKEEHAMKRIARKEPNEKRIAALVRDLLVELGEDPERDGLRKTPQRVAKSLAFLTRGYRQNLKAVVNGAKFASGTNHMVILKDIELYSLCEHHMLPFYG